MSATIEQKIAQKEAEIARLKQQQRKKENGQKIIIGGLMLSVAKKDPKVAKQLLDLINSQVTRKADEKRIEDIVEVLQKKARELNQQFNSQ